MEFLSIVLLVVFVKDGLAINCDFINPLYTWPLGRGKGSRLANSFLTSGEVGNTITYGSGPASLGYDAYLFDGDLNDFVDVRIEGDENTIPDDYSFIFFVYPIVSDGVLMHFTSDEEAVNKTTGLEVALLSSKIVVSVSGVIDETIETNITLPLNSWSKIGIERDLNINFKVYVEPSLLEERDIFAVGINNVKTSFPGNVRLGLTNGNIVGSIFEGRITCLQLCLCKKPFIGVNYDGFCAESLSLSITTTKPPATATTQPTTTTTQPPATTTTQPTTTTSYISTTSTMLSNSWYAFGIVGCTRYTLKEHDVTFGSPGDIVATFVVMNINDCIGYCQRAGPCESFVFIQGTGMLSYCYIGTDVFSTVPSPGKNLYVPK